MRGPAREGVSLVAGLLRCGHCGRRLHVTYGGASSIGPRYQCSGAARNHGAARCIAFGGLRVDHAIEPMAQRARKILQEEGSHRVHAEAWARRLCRAGERDALVACLLETWEHAGRWPGPADDPDVRAAVEQGMLRHDAAQQRERVRAWLVDLLGTEGVPIALDEPTDWSRWDPELRRYEP